MNSNMSIKGVWTITEYDLNDNIVSENVINNIITDTAKTKLAEWFANGFVKNEWCIVLGTNDNTPLASDIALNTPVSITANTGTLTVANNKLTYKVVYDSNDTNGVYYEAGIYDGIIPTGDTFIPITDYTNGYLFNHVLFDPLTIKSELNKLTITVDITFGA
ncbi:hypothetical protein HNP86_001868 [Methanococcus maripaludis]|uniref:Uncharacterized protein n=1 Tax=Methanococcus maripaludis TaxID=39152 RepID=A0A7J9NVK8_METMI|nr:hypothetical protein [Methanococcus maripaludis]MBA2851709.1 hypothetical protein [Methanococcus maripaludis]